MKEITQAATKENMPPEPRATGGNPAALVGCGETISSYIALPMSNIGLSMPKIMATCATTRKIATKVACSLR